MPTVSIPATVVVGVRRVHEALSGCCLAAATADLSDASTGRTDRAADFATDLTEADSTNISARIADADPAFWFSVTAGDLTNCDGSVRFPVRTIDSRTPAFRPAFGQRLVAADATRHQGMGVDCW